MWNSILIREVRLVTPSYGGTWSALDYQQTLLSLKYRLVTIATAHRSVSDGSQKGQIRRDR